MNSLKYISHYPQAVQLQVSEMMAQNKIANWLRSRYSDTHSITNDNELRDYVMAIKNQYMKKAQPLSKVTYDSKLHIVNHALGMHTYVSRVQGAKLKSKNELRVSSLFKQTPDAFLNMIVVHELAHLKEKEHNYS